MARLFRTFKFDRQAVNKDDRTVPVSFSSETPVDRGFYTEILDHGAVDLTRLENGAPLLHNHDPNRQIGVVESAEIDKKDKMGRAVVRFGKSALATEIFNDVQDGVIRNVSVGYERTTAISQKQDEKGYQTIRFAFTPMEISMVAVPADPSVGVGRSVNNDDYKEIMNRSLLLDKHPSEGGGSSASQTEIEITRNKARDDEQKRWREINAAGERMASDFPDAAKKFRDLAVKHASEGTGVADFNAILLNEIPGIRKIEQEKTAPANLGLSQKEIKEYSFSRAIQSVIKKEKCYEFELSQEAAKRYGMSAEGFIIPHDILVGCGQRGIYRRDLNVTTGSQGGDFVATQLVATPIEILRNRMVTPQLGIQVMSGLQGNVAIPRQTGAATASSVSESAALVTSTQAINQVSLTPKRVGSTNNYTKQLLLQSSTDVENFVREDLMKIVAIRIDLLTLEGQGAASEPVGIANTTGINTVTFGGAATWANVIAFETGLASNNADVGRMGYVTTPTVRGKWKSVVKVSNTASFLWENNLPTMFTGPAADYGVGSRGPFGMVNGYMAGATNQVSGNRVYFANWEDVILGMWGGFDVVVDPYTLAKNAEVVITVNTFFDIAVRHALSICCSTDAGNQ